MGRPCGDWVAMTEPALVALAGMAGSLHCFGMCGGFACAIGDARRGHAAQLGRQLAYNAGRVTTYVFIGALAGQAGMFLIDLCGEQWGIAAQRALAVVAGALMVFIGLQFAGLLHHAALTAPKWLGEALVRWLRPLLQAPGIGAPLALGALNGWLPCPLVYAFAAQAAGSGSVRQGALLMLCFGLGTFPAMLLAGGLGWWARRGALDAGAAPLRFMPRGTAAAPVDPRVWSIRLGAVFIVSLGLLTLARGMWPSLTMAGMH